MFNIDLCVGNPFLARQPRQLELMRAVATFMQQFGGKTGEIRLIGRGI
jgi:hypothetical protein